jgi:hypothetical protein
MHWHYLVVGLVVGFFAGYALQDLHWQSFFSRLLYQPGAYRIDISPAEGLKYEVAFHHGKKKRHVDRVICRSVRDGIIKHLHGKRGKL